MITTVKTTICTRCGGTGNHSYNAKDGTLCYGCNGTGQISVTAKGKKIKATAEKHKAVVGDIIEQVNFYKVLEIKDLETDKIIDHLSYNQVLIVQNVVSEKYARVYRWKAKID